MQARFTILSLSPTFCRSRTWNINSPKNMENSALFSTFELRFCFFPFSRPIRYRQAVQSNESFIFPTLKLNPLHQMPAHKFHISLHHFCTLFNASQKFNTAASSILPPTVAHKPQLFDISSRIVISFSRIFHLQPRNEKKFVQIHHPNKCKSYTNISLCSSI